MRWQEPHACSAAPACPFTTRGAEPCSSGNQSGGFAPLATFSASYSLLLPGTWIGPVAGTVGGCTLSGMLNAQEGRPLGIDSGACAAAPTTRNGARRRALIQSPDPLFSMDAPLLPGVRPY